ncbi:Golgi-associated plant pathogenesis-related protein 1-like isoform X1 [Entelurus aequoreus]|uniref:Golgi-associated plant pathogenesis-related protein 1-like isoform X1 n=1 Tax=Entelurus aequoreus TaxID=161455 RepID=UPI002B1D4FF7|nr:Golgi-associated plant pathogenesis-related protein 1-like isoform X1 [Entelurus aequoreus]
MADESFQRDFLEAHNAYRAKHGSPPMALSQEVSAAAQLWADRLLASGAMRHSNTADGENIYTKWSSATIELTGKEAVDSWYSEINNYNWSRPGFSSGTGHFTQVVWKESVHLGVGMATDGHQVFVVGQYRPAGNMNRQQHFMANVLPPAEGGASGDDTPCKVSGDDTPCKVCGDDTPCKVSGDDTPCKVCGDDTPCNVAAGQPAQTCTLQ